MSSGPDRLTTRTPPSTDDRDERVAQLVRTISEAEDELQALLGGQLDAVVADGQAPYLLRDAQAQLRQSESAQRALAETQSAILNALPAHIALLDANGVIQGVNEAWRRFASANVLQSTDFCVGQNYLGICEASHGECAEEAVAVAAGLRKVLSGESKGFALEYPCHSPSERRWFRLMVTPLSETSRAGAVVMHINVTERRQAEEVLRQREQEQRRLAEDLATETRRLHQSQAAANVGSWETDLITRESRWTEETHRIFETSPEVFTPTHQGFLARVHPDDRPRVVDAFAPPRDRAGSFAVEHRLLFPDGRVKHVELRGQVVLDAAGLAVRAIGTCQDITQRKRADEVVQTRARQQETIARIGFEATRARTLQDIFDFTTAALAGALAVEYTKVLQLAPDGRSLRLVSGVGWRPGLVGVATVGVGRESQAGFTLQSDSAIYVNDFARETRFEAPPLLREHEVVSGLSVTIKLRDKPWGVLGAHSRSARHFSDVDADFMQAIAVLLAVVIERLAVQRTLTESEARMRDAQRIAHLGNWELEITQNRLLWSEEVFRIFGAAPTAFDGSYEGFLAFVHPDDREAVQAAQRAALSGQELLDVEHRIIRPDGRIRHVRERGELILDEGGQPVALSGTVLDITDLRAAQSRAERMNALLSEAQQIANLGHWEMDVASGRLVWSEETCRLFGIEPEAFEGTFDAFTQFLLPQDRASFDAVHAALSPAAPQLEAEYRIRRPDGQVRWLFERGRVTFDAAGKAVRRLGVVMDVTELRRAEAELRESEERFRLMIEGSEQVLFYTHDREHRFDYLSPSTREVLGYEPGDLVGQPCDLLVIADDPQNADVHALTDQALQDGKPCEPYKAVVRHKDGRRIVLEILESPILRDGQIVGIQGFARDITERENALAALEESQRQYRDLVETSHDLIWAVDAEGRITYLNPACRAIYGREPEEMIGRSFLDFVPAEQAARDVAVFRAAMQAGHDTLDYTSRVYRKDGSIVRLSASARVVRDRDGRIIGSTGISRDVTLSERAQEAVAQSEARFRGLFEQAAVGMCIVSTEGLFLRANARFCQIVGYSAEELLQRDSIETTHPDDRPREAELVARMLAGELQTDTWEKRYLRKDGHPVWCTLTLSLLPASDGQAPQFVGVVDDITARRAAELARQETDTRLREQAALLDKAQDAILVRDLGHHITYWNGSAARLYGWPAEEAMGRRERELLYGDQATFDRAVEQLLAHGEWTGELRHRRRDGRILDIEGRWTLVRDAAGRPGTVLALYTDVTERRQNQRLAQRSQRLESIGTMAGGIAHDLNNALAPIMLGGETLRMEYPGDSEILEMIESGSKRAADMVKQLLAFAKGAAGERVSVEVDRLFNEVEKLIRGTFPKNIQLVIKRNARLPTVLGDATQLHQVFLNLCVNARDAMPSGGTLTLEGACEDVDAVYASSVHDAKPGRYVVLRVRDTGTGIAPDVLDRIFEPFFTTKGPDKGTGLGLSTVMGIVKGHGGFVQVYSHLGQGSTFSAYLPAEVATSEAAPLVVAPEQFRGQGETILFVDDEAALRQTARMVLQRLHFTPMIATDGADGLIHVAKHSNDIRVVITDLHMPHMDGLGFVRALRRILPEVPVLVASGRMEDDVAEALKAMGVTARLDKPFTERQLAVALQALLRPR